MSIVKSHVLNGTAKIILNRPEKRNAFNGQMIKELHQAFLDFKDHDCRCIVLSGEGPAFSAGADLEYMKEIKNAGHKENLKEAGALADLLYEVYNYPKPVIARVHGPAIGGGVGLIAACDIAIASKGAFFMFSEVRLGLVPAVIGPYVVKKMGESASRFYMLTAEKFNAEEALEKGLVQQVVMTVDLDNRVNRIASSIEGCGPEALKHCKELVKRCGEQPVDDIKDWTANLIADLRASEEGQEGLGSFLDKRKPGWIK